jgi:hypothetical protein
MTREELRIEKALLLGSRAAEWPFSSCQEKNTVAIGHDPFLVVLSVLIAVQASYVSLSLSGNVKTSFGLQRRLCWEARRCLWP